MSYQSDTQKLKATKVKEHSSIVDEKLLSERVYYGDQTHVYVGYLRAFKSGYFEGTKIRKITDIAKLLVASENFTKRARGEQKPLTYSTIITELATFEQVLGIKTVLMGFGLESNAIHSPNENIPLDIFRKGIEAVVEFYLNYK